MVVSDKFFVYIYLDIYKIENTDLTPFWGHSGGGEGGGRVCYLENDESKRDNLKKVP